VLTGDLWAWRSCVSASTVRAFVWNEGAPRAGAICAFAPVTVLSVRQLTLREEAGSLA
jgi:hypothetical protein